MAFDQYGMPTDNGQGSGVGTRAPKASANNPASINASQSDTNVSNPNGVGEGTGVVGPTAASNNGGTTPFDREGFMNAWMGSSGTAQDFQKSNPQYASAFGNGSKNSDVFTLPTSETLDLVGDAGGANKHNWTQVGGGGTGGGSGISGAGGGSAMGGAPGSGGGGYNPYTPGQLPQANFQTYSPGQQNPQIQQALQTALGGGALSPEVQAQMQGQLKDQALTMQQGQMQDARQGNANRGMGAGGGLQSTLSGIQQNTQSNLLNNYRDLGVTAAQSNRSDLMNAINAGQQDYGQQQQLAQQGVQSQNAATQYALQRSLEEEGMKQAAAGLGVQTRGQDLGNAFNYANLAQQGNIANNQLGLGYANLNSNNQNTQQSALLRALGLA